MGKVNQEEYDQVIRTIEQNTCYRFSAGTDDSGAFLIPVTGDDKPMSTPFYLTWNKLKKLAALGPPPS